MLKTLIVGEDFFEALLDAARQTAGPILLDTESRLREGDKAGVDGQKKGPGSHKEEDRASGSTR